MTKKAKIVVIAILVVFVVIVGSIAHAISNTAKVQETEFTFEYGNKVNITSKDIFGKNVDAKIDVSEISNEAGKDYPGIGEYTGTVTYNNMTSNLTIVVADTKKPVFTKAPSKVELGLFEGTHSFKADFKAKDISEVKYSFETSDIRFDQNGTYDAIAIATDTSGNTVKKKFKVIVGTGIDATDQQSAEDVTMDSSTATKKSKKTTTKTEDSDTSNQTANSTTNGGYYDAYGGYTDAYGNYWPANASQGTQGDASYSGNSGNGTGYGDYSDYSTGYYGDYN